jgi:hypothetical protein
MSLKAEFKRSYTKKESLNKVFVYEVTGSKADMEKYETIQGEFYKVDNESGKALYFASKFFGDHGNLIITSNNNVVPDMSEFDKAASLASQFGGNLGQELARASAAKLVGRRTNSLDTDDADGASDL